LYPRLRWIQQDVIEYLREENRVLKEKLRGKGLHVTDDQRRRLAAQGHPPVSPIEPLRISGSETEIDVLNSVVNSTPS